MENKFSWVPLFSFGATALIGFLFIFPALSGCGKRENLGISTQELLADQMGEILASVDEFSGASGNFLLGQSLKTGSSKSLGVVFLQPQPIDGLIPMIFTSSDIVWGTGLIWALSRGLNILQQAQANSCLDTLMGNCEAYGGGRKLIRTLANCTIGSASLSGFIEFKFSSPTSCHLGALGSTATRHPNFEITGPAGAKFVADVTGSYGQKMTHTDLGVFSFESDGIRRRLIAGTTTIANYVTKTDSAIRITGDFRHHRELDSGKLIVENLTNESQCSFIPLSVKWSQHCNCPTSGSWSVTCSDGTVGSLTHTSCTEGSFVLDGSTRAVKFARCGGLNP